MSMALRVGVCVCITSLSAPGYAGAQFPVPAAPDTGQVAVLATVADMAIDTGQTVLEPSIRMESALLAPASPPVSVLEPVSVAVPDPASSTHPIVPQIMKAAATARRKFNADIIVRSLGFRLKLQ